MNGSATTPPPTSSAATSSDKLSGQLIIKAQLGDDIRKMMIHNEDLTLNELVLMMERIFAGKISNSDELTIKYLDEDGDKITLLNDSDLTVALHFQKVLRLFVLVNGNEQIAESSSDAAAATSKEGSLIDAKTFRGELQQIRNSVQTILDRLQLSSSQSATTQEKDTSSTAAVPAPTPAVASSTTREFDPYKHLQQSQRSTTPDSIRSRSSASNTTNQFEQKAFQPTSTAPPADTQQQYPPAESADGNKTAASAFQQMPTPHFAPSGFVDQQGKTSPFGPPPTSYAGMPPLPTAGGHQMNSAFPPSTMPSANPSSSAFNPTSAPPTTFSSATAPPNAFNPATAPPAMFNPNTAPPSAFNPTSAPPSAFNAASAPPPSSNLGQPGTFIGQQQQQQQQQLQQQTPLAPPPQQGGFYGQQQALQQQRPGLPGFTPNVGMNNAFGQQQQLPQGPPPSSSSPATINPSFVQPTAMPAPPPLASKQPYGGFPGQANFFNPGAPYPK